MTGRRFDRAAELVEQLGALGIRATRSPGGVYGIAPGVLVGPPSLTPGTYSGPTVTWRLLAVSAAPIGDETAWQQLDELLEQLLDALPVERADPTTYQLDPASPALPAYAVTFTESE